MSPRPKLVSVARMGGRASAHWAPQCLLCGRHALFHARPSRPLPPHPRDTPHLSASSLSSKPQENWRNTQLERLASSTWRVAAVGWEGVGGLGGLELAIGEAQSCALPVLGCVLLEGHMTSLRLTFLGYRRNSHSNLPGLWHPVVHSGGAAHTVLS